MSLGFLQSKKFLIFLIFLFNIKFSVCLISKFEKCFIFEYKPEMWVIQPLAPSTEWLANAYTYAEWPWEGSWDGDVKRINVIK